MDPLKRTVPFLLFPLIAVGLTACGHSEAASMEAAGAKADRPAFVLRTGRMNSRLTLPGELQAFERVDLYAKVNSFVRDLRADVGSEVKAGQVLATLEAPEIGAQLAAAGSRLQAQEAQYTAAKATYDRLLATSRTPGTISPNDLDQALAAMNAAKAQLDAARGNQGEVSAQRDYLTIRAPFDGIVTLRNINPGAYVGPATTPLFTVQQQKKLRLVVSVPEDNVAALHAGDTVHFTARAMPGQRFTAQVTRLAGTLDDRLRAQRTEMDVVNTDGRLLPGMVVQVELPLTSAADAFAVPAGSVLRSTLGTFVIRNKGGKAQRVPVRTGLINKEEVQVFGELAAGDTLLFQVNDEITDGTALGPVAVK